MYKCSIYNRVYVPVLIAMVCSINPNLRLNALLVIQNAMLLRSRLRHTNRRHPDNLDIRKV